MRRRVCHWLRHWFEQPIAWPDHPLGRAMTCVGTVRIIAPCSNIVGCATAHSPMVRFSAPYGNRLARRRRALFHDGLPVSAQRLSRINRLPPLWVVRLEHVYNYRSVSRPPNDRRGIGVCVKSAIAVRSDSLRVVANYTDVVLERTICNDVPVVSKTNGLDCRHFIYQLNCSCFSTGRRRACVDPNCILRKPRGRGLHTPC
jgi:hypothetical protein